MKPRTAAFLSAVAIASASLIAGAPTAHASAAASCYGSSCNGVEPNGTTCASDAITAHSTTLSGRTIQLRYSPSCRAAWGKISGATVGNSVDVLNTNGNYQSATVNSGSDTHTRMVNDAGITSDACGYVGSSSACTASY